MKSLLVIKSSLQGSAGQSSQLADLYSSAWQSANSDGKVVVRDLSLAEMPHLDAARFGALLSAPEARTPDQQAVVDFSDGLIAELISADEIVLGLPMYNFTIPSQLKSYFDYLARAGVTFQYTATGPVGLLKDRKVTVLAARGGIYQGTPADTQTGLVKTFLGFIGLQSVEFIYAEGLNMGPESREKALAAARQRIAQRAV